MAVTGREAPVTYAAPTTYAERGMEVLWLLTAALVPLIFVPTDYMLSEAVNAYVEVPKTTALRTLAGLMAILWIVEWVLKGGLSRRYSLANYPTRLKNWVVEQPSRWVVVAATVYVVVTIVTTFLSVSFWISMWGEVSGQFGYSAYTTVSYFLVFAVVATHLKTQDQLWRLLGVIVAMGALVALYGMVQHYGIDPLNLGETGSARVTATMANPVFTGAVLVVTALMTVGTGLLVLDRMGWKPVRVCLWVLLISAQFMVVFWTGSRGSFLLGVPIGLIAFLVLAPFAFAPRNFGSPLKTILRLVSGAVTAGFAFERRIFTKTFLVIASGLLITLAVVAFTPSPSDKSVGDVDASTVAVGQVEERLASIKATAVRGGVSYRTDIWEGALGLVVRRPWFAYENLSISFLRPLVGYGPELFKYTFPLESPLGGLLSQAHNFWVHHWVEQGLLGLFSSLGLFVALFIVGVAQLWRNREVYSTTHKWILVTLLATVAGRGAEMMVGVARESDLVLFWIILAIFVALPSVMSPSREAQATPVPERPLRLAGRRERRGGRLGRRDRSGRRTSGESGGQMGVPLGIGLVLVSAVIIFIGWLTWDKNVDYAWAAVLAASARDQFREGDFQESQRLMSKAVAKAPDVPMYYHNLAGIYDAYKEIATNDPERQLPPCEEVFPLKHSGNPAQSDRPYASCAEEAYFTNLAGFRKNSNSPQVKLVLANSTLQLALLDREAYEGKDEEAIRYYRELTQMIRYSWPLRNGLATAHIRLGHPEEALVALKESLSTTLESADSAHAHYLRGLALGPLDKTQEAIGSFEQSLEMFGDSPNAEVVQRQLTNAYNGLALAHLQRKEAEEALEPLEKSLALAQESPSSGTPLYLQGLAYRQLNELQSAADSLERSLEVDENGAYAKDAHRQLADVYVALGDQARADEHTKLYEGLNQR